MGCEDDIRELCLELLGTIDQAHMTWLSAICVAAQDELFARLRSDTDVNDFRDTFITAAAMLSVSLMKQIDDPGLADFTAATVKLTFSEDRSQMAQTAYRMIAPWCADSFAFRSVRA